MTKLLIGILSYNDLKLLKQSLGPVEKLRKSTKATVVVMDTAWNDKVQNYIEKEFPKFNYIRHEKGNIGYGKSFNYMLQSFPGHDTFMVLTSDVLIDPPVVSRMVNRMARDKKLMLTAGKLHYWDLTKGGKGIKTDQIDSLGIWATKKHHFVDLGHGEKDEGQYDGELEKVFGVSGAVFLVRTSVVRKLYGEPDLLFDPRMWMYKEDIDLSYRLRWLGEKIKIYPEVWAWHARTLANKEGQGVKAWLKADSKKNLKGRHHSYRNHLLLLKNNLSFKYGFRVLAKVFVYETAKAGFMFFRHPRVFWCGLATLLFVPARRSNRRVSAKKMLTKFH